MSARSYFRRSIVPLLSLLLVGGAAYMLWQSPFAVRELKHRLITGLFDPRAEGFEDIDLHDPVTIRACEELVSDPQWNERVPAESKNLVIRVLELAKSEALAPALQALIVDWNRQVRVDHRHRFFVAFTVSDTLLSLDTASAREARAQLEREFPPFPRPYASTLPHYLKQGKRAEVIALAHSIIDTARRNSGPTVNAYGSDLQELGEGLRRIKDPIPVEILELELAVFAIQFLDGGHPILHSTMRRREGIDLTAPLLRHLPEIPTINDAQMNCLANLWRDNCLPPQTLPAALAQLRQEAGGDVEKIHWLKKQMIMDVLKFNGTPADLPLLEALKGDPFLVRTLEKRHPDKTREKGRQDARAPIPPGWSEVSTDSLGSLAEKIHTDIRKKETRRAAQRAAAEAEEAAKPAAK